MPCTPRAPALSRRVAASLSTDVLRVRVFAQDIETSVRERRGEFLQGHRPRDGEDGLAMRSDRFSGTVPWGNCPDVQTVHLLDACFQEWEPHSDDWTALGRVRLTGNPVCALQPELNWLT